MTKPISILLFLGIFTACALTDNPNSLDNKFIIDFEKKDFAPIISILKVINLESTRDALFAQPHRLVMTDDYIYISDRERETIRCFDQSGKYITKIVNGKGPGECLNIRDFTKSHYSDTIYAWDQWSFRINRYIGPLRFIDTRFVDRTAINSLKMLPDRNWLIQVSNKFSISGKSYAYAIYSHDFSTILDSILPIATGRESFMLFNPISRTAETIFTKQFDNNIYQLSDGMLEVKYELDFLDFNVEAGLQESMDILIEGLRDGVFVGSIDNLIESGDFLIFSFLKQEYQYCIYQKSTGDYALSNEIENQNLLPKGLILASKEDGFYLVSEPKNYIDFLKRSGPEKATIDLDEEDNPVIIHFKIT